MYSLTSFNTENVFLYFGAGSFFLLLSFFLLVFAGLYRIVQFQLGYKIIWIQNQSQSSLIQNELDSLSEENPSSSSSQKENWYQYLNKILLFAEVAGQTLFLFAFLLGIALDQLFDSLGSSFFGLDENMLRLGILWTFAFYITDILVDTRHYFFIQKDIQSFQKSIEKQAQWYSKYALSSSSSSSSSSFIVPKVMIVKPDPSNIYWNLFHHVVTAAALLGWSPFLMSDFTFVLFLGSIPLSSIYLWNFFFNRKKSPKFLQFHSHEAEHQMNQHMREEFQSLLHFISSLFKKTETTYSHSHEWAEEKETQLKEKTYRWNALLYFFLRIVPFTFLVFRIQWSQVRWWNLPIFFMLPLIYLDNLSHAKYLMKKPFPAIYEKWDRMDKAFLKLVSSASSYRRNKGEGGIE